MKHYKQILVTGGHGMLGKHLQKTINGALFPTRKQLDLCNYNSIIRFLKTHKPKYIIHAAAKVGGIIDNISYPYNFFEQNSIINTNIIRAAISTNTPRLLAISSTCAYPDIVDRYPIVENMLHDGPPAKSNFSYAYAKRSMSVQIDAANQQMGTKYNYVFPCNLYSEFDSLHNPKKMHFITSLLYKIIQAEFLGLSSIELFGSGRPLRQFMYAGDLARIIKFIIDHDIQENFNIAPDNSNLSIDYMARQVLNILGKKQWPIYYDITKPDGQYRKDVSNKLMKECLGTSFKFTSFKDNIQRIYKNYVKQMAIKNQKKINTQTC